MIQANEYLLECVNDDGSERKIALDVSNHGDRLVIGSDATRITITLKLISKSLVLSIDDPGLAKQELLSLAVPHDLAEPCWLSLSAGLVSRTRKLP